MTVGAPNYTVFIALLQAPFKNKSLPVQGNSRDHFLRTPYKKLVCLPLTDS